MNADFSGQTLHAIWEAGRDNGLTQRKLASYLGVSFNSVHGKIFREQKRVIDLPVSGKAKPRVMLRSAVFDIETMDFTTGGVNNHLVCVCILPLDSDEVQTLELKFEDEGDDRRLLAEAIEALSEYDILIGHNIAAFDSGWIRSRLAYHGLDLPTKKWLYYDTYQAARRMAIKADRKSLGFLCDFFQVPFEKTSILPVAWSKVDSRKRDEFDEAMQNVTYHCATDVISNRNLFDALWPLDRSMANLPVMKK